MCICRVVKCLALSVTGFEQICARWRAVVVTYNKSADCANMPKTVRLKCSTEVGYGYLQRVISLRRLAAKAVKGAARRGEAHGAYARKSAIFDGGSPHLNIKITKRGGLLYITPLS